MTRRARAALAAALACGAVLAAALAPAAQAAHLNFATVEQQYMCVTCNLPLPESQSDQADRERAFIRMLIAKGDTSSQIRSQMVAVYGEAVLQLPPAKGFTLVGYIVPIAAVVLLVGLLLAVLPRWRRRGTARFGAAGAPPLDDADSRRLDQDLALHDR